MSVVSTLSSKNKDNTRAAGIVAFAIDEATVRQLEQSFDQLGVAADAYVARGGMDAVISHLGRVDKSPKRLIVDISGLDEPLAALDRLAQACDPSVMVYVLGESNDVTLYRSLLQVGVRDYRYKPLTVEALRAWLNDREGSFVRKARSGKVIAVTGTRGGIGVTSVAACLARQLSAGKGLRRVTYLDMDLYGGTGSTLLGVASNHALPDILQNIDRLDPAFLERTLTSEDGRLFVLAANQSYSDVLAPGNGLMQALLGVLSQHFHYVVVDLHSPGGAMANEIFAHADIVCVLTDRSVHSARVLASLLLHINGRPAAPTTHVVINSPRAPVRGRLESKEFEKAISSPVALEIPYDGKLPGLAEDLGEPLASGSELARAVAKLTRMITGEQMQVANSRVVRWFKRSA